MKLSVKAYIRKSSILEEDKILRSLFRAPARRKGYIQLCELYQSNPKPFPPTWFAVNVGEPRIVDGKSNKLKPFPSEYFHDGIKAGLFEFHHKDHFYDTYTITEKGLEVGKLLKELEG